MSDKPRHWPNTIDDDTAATGTTGSGRPQSEGPGEPGPRRRNAAAICRIAMGLELAGLVIQFLLGMGLNLYVAHPHRQPVVIAHIGLGFTLVACAVVAIAASLLARNWAYLRVSLIGLAALLLAVTGGLRFLRAGQHNLDSYLMALGFIAALVIFGAGIRLSDHRPNRRSSGY